MATAKVVSAFFDKNDPKRTVYNVGDTFEGAAERIEELQAKGFVKAEKAVEEKTEKPKAARKPRATAKK